MIMVLDATGVIRILDWLSASSTEAAKPSEIDGLSDASKHTILTFSDPRSLAGSLTHAKRAHGAAAWKSQDPNVFGALLDGRWCVFDLRRLSGGKPIAVGEAHGSDGIGAFR